MDISGLEMELREPYKVLLLQIVINPAVLVQCPVM